jgi:hypothetical protein
VRVAEARVAEAVAFAQIGNVGFDGQIELEVLRLYGLLEAVPPLLCGTPLLPVGTRDFQVETALDLPNLAPGATHLADVTVIGCRQGGLVSATLTSSIRFIEFNATAWHQTGPGDGRKHLTLYDFRSRLGGAFGGGDEATDTLRGGRRHVCCALSSR